MAQFLGILFNAFVVVFFFGFTIFVHEWGHFWVARRLGFKVLEFSIGFGPALWRKVIDGISWKIGIIPLGGYVKLPQMDPTGASLSEDEKKDPLPLMEPWRRIAVGVAGVTCNMILAVLLAVIVSWIGRPATERDCGTTLDLVYSNSVLYAEGLRPGDTIERVNGSRVSNWEEVIVESALNPRVLILARRGRETFEVKFETNSVASAIEVFLTELAPVAPAVIGPLFTNWPAYQSGLRTGDEIVSIDGTPIHSIGLMRSLITGSGGKELRIEFRRGGALMSVAVTPRFDVGASAYRIGNTFQGHIVHPSPLDEITYAAGAVNRTLNKFKRFGSARRAFDALGGVPEIFLAFWQRAKEGLITAFSLAVTLNVNLAIMNLLPIPVLDGGHILLALYEWIRRRQASVKFVAALWQASAVVLISFMLMLTLRGIYRVTMWNSRSNDAAAAAATNRAAAPAQSLLSQEPVSAPP